MASLHALITADILEICRNQQTSGSALMGQATYFFQQAGLDNSAASTLNLCMFAVGAIGTIGSWFIMKPFGRRTLFLYGQASCTLLMLLVGVLGTTTKKGGSGGWAIGALLITFTFLYGMSRSIFLIDTSSSYLM